MKRNARRTTESDKKLRRYYERNSALASGRKLSRVEVSFPRPRKLVALRIEPETLAAVRKLAAERGLNYSTLMRMWITECLRREIR
ncbi:MAG: hypothetical protein ABIJ96_11200 [Elusimicrobiota bacterium]